MKAGVLVVGLIGILALHAPAQEADKVEQYRGMLLKRPENSVLFGRLVDAWLENGEMAGLKQMLETKAAAGGAPDWRLLAVFRSFSGDEAGAIAALDEALKKSPEEGATRLARAKALGAASRFEDALADLDVAAKDAALRMETGTLRGKFLTRAGRPAEAVKAWKEVIAAHPGDEGLREDLIELEIGEGMLEEAVAAAGELSDQTADPYQKALRRMRVAEILSQAGKKNEAVEKYLEVFAVSAEGSWLEREVLARVNALFSREDDAAGLRGFYNRLREIYPRRVVVKKEAARSLMASGEGDEAVAMFREVLKVLPGDRETRDEFIALLEGAGRFKDAAEEISALLATAQKDPALWEKLAGIRKSMGDEAGLKQAVDKAVALAPEGEAGQLAAASMYERYGRADDAERTLREAVKAHGLAGEAGDALAVLLASRGKPDEAIGLWREMAKTADREGLLRIARSLTANGRAADAYGILSSRMAGFEGDPLLLAALCQAAQLADQAEGAIPQALELVRQAKTSGDLETALRQALALVFRAKEPRKWIDELAAKANPSTQELCLLAEMHETTGDSIQADRILKQALAGGDPLLAAAQRVRLFELRGDFAAAIGATRDWLAMPGGLRTEQVKRLVDLTERSGDIGAALRETENWKRIAPGDKLAWTKRAELYQTDGKPEQAVAELRRALAKFGSDEEMRANLAGALSKAEMFAEAWRMLYGLYDEAESSASKLKWAGTLAEMASREGREDELVNDFKRRARDNPTSVTPLLALAEMYRQWLRPDEEIQVITEASRRKPDEVSLLQRLADLEEQSGNLEKSEALLKKALRAQDSPDNRRRLSAFWIRGGDTERGLAELLAAKGGASPRETEKLVMPLLAVKNHDAALRVLAAEAPRHPDDWRLAYLYALALQEAGRKDEAFTRFAALLEAKGDLPGVLPVIPADQMKWIMAEQADVPGYALFVRFQVLTDPSPNRRNMGYGLSQSGVPLPGTVTEARWMAICQALALAEQDPETRAARLAALTSGEMPELDLIKTVHALKPDELRKLMMAEDADPRLFRWYLETGKYNISYQKQRQDIELLRKGVERCAKTDPVLALRFLSGLPFAAEDGRRPDEARQMFELIAALDDKKRANCLGSLQQLAFADEKQVPEDVRQKAELLLLADLKVARAKSGDASQQISYSLALQRMRAGRFDEAATLLNEAYESGKKAKPQAAMNHSMNLYGRGYSGWRGRGSEGQLQFPAVLAMSLNPVVQSGFNMESRSGAPKPTAAQTKLLDLLGEKAATHPNQPAPGKPIDPEGLARMLPQLADPYLRIFLAQTTAKPELVAREIEAMEKSSAEDPVALQIAAAYHMSITKDPAKAYLLLAKACQVAKAGGSRDAMDASLYQLGLSLAAKPPEGLDLEPARRAALRLRKSMALDEGTKRQFAAGMAKLGLEEESRRYVAAPKTIGGYRPGYSGMRAASPSRQASSQQALAALVNQGKPDLAARRILNDLRRIQANPSGSNHEEAQLFTLITSLKIEDSVVKIAEPPDGAGYQNRRDFAMLLSRLKKPEKALPLLRALADEKPEDIEIRAALLAVLPPDERKAFVLTLPAGKFDSERIGTWFTSMLERDSGTKVDDYLSNTEMLVMFLEKIPPAFDAERNLSWANYLASGLCAVDRFGEVKLRPLLRAANDSEKYDDERSKIRDDLVRRLHQAMLRHPQTCEQGFILMFAYRIPLETPVEALDQAALAAVSLAWRIKEDTEVMRRYGGNRSQRLWMWTSQSGGGNSGSPPEGGLDPMTYLMRQAADEKAIDPFTPDLLAELSTADPAKGKELTECLKIVATPGLDAFNSWREVAAQNPDAGWGQLLAITRMAVFKQRADLLDAVLDFACDLALDKKQRQYGGMTGVSEVFTLLVSNADGLPGKTRAIDRITRRLLGPPEAWALYGPRDQNQSVYAIQMRLSMFQQFAQFIQGDAGSAVALARFTAGNRLGPIAEIDLRQLLYGGRGSPDAAAAVKRWLESGVLAPGPELAGFSRSNGTSLIEALEQNGNSNFGADKERKKLGDLLLAMEGPERFWARFLGARLNKAPAAAIAELDANAAAIAKWPAHARIDLARITLKWFPEAEKSAGAALKRLLVESRKQDEAELRRLAQAYLKQELPADQPPESILGKLREMMFRLIKLDPALAVEVWSKYQANLQKVQSGQPSGSQGFNPTLGQSANSQLLQSFLNSETSVSRLAEFVALLEKKSPGLSSGMFDSNGFSYVNQKFNVLRDRAADTYANDKALAMLKPEGRAYAGVLSLMGRETAKEARSVLACLLLMDSFNRGSYGYDSNPQFLDWTRKELKKSGPELADAAILMSVTHRDRKVTDAEKTEMRDAWRRFLKNGKIPEAMRVSVVSSVMARSNVAYLNDDPACVTGMADLFATGGANWRSGMFFEAFKRLSELKALTQEDAAKVLIAIKANLPQVASQSPDDAAAQMNRVLFALALRSRDALELTRLIRNDSDFYQGNLALAIRLWQNDLPAVALALLARPGEYHAGIPGISGNATPLQFSREIEAGLTPWLATIEDPSQRFRIECLISCLPDAEGDPAPEHKRFERVEALVKRFPAEVPKARVSRNEILAALATETGPARALANEYDEAVGKETLGSLQSIREEDSRNPKTIGSSEVMKTLIRHSMQYALEERGDATVFLRHLKSLNVAAVGNQQSRATQVMRELAPWYSALLVRRMVGLPAEERAEPARQALEITRNLLEWEGVDRDSLIVSLAVTSQAAAGDGAALDRWVETLPPLLKTRYSSWWSGNRPYASIGILRQPAFSGKEFEKSRLALIAAMLGDSATLAREMRPDTAVSEFISHFPLQPADVIAVIDLIPENNPRRAEFLALKALHLGRMDGKEEETLAIFAAAETAAAGNDKQLDSVRAAHVMYLVRRPDRRDDALVIAKTINLDNLAPQERRSLEAHLKRFAPKEPKE